MTGRARQTTLPHFVITETTTAESPFATRIDLPGGTAYFIQPKLVADRSFGQPPKKQRGPASFDTYPLVLRSNGAPWDEANLFIFAGIEGKPDRKIATFNSQAEDLAAYCRFFEEEDVDWRDFPAHKSKKPTYRFRNYLTHEVWNGKLAATTAKRRLGVIVRFYRWLIEEQLLKPENPPWKEEKVSIRTTSSYGRAATIKVKTTDLRIKITEQKTDEYSEYIQDGGKLRPLPPQQQEWLIATLRDLGNTEMTLIHLLALLTGARIQTVLTFRVHNALESHDFGPEKICLVGPGTGIDTKNSKRQALRIPTWFHEQLKTYANSDRALKRRKRSGTDSQNQYLFLSVRGAPMYVSAEKISGSPIRLHKYAPRGQAVRQYMKDYIIPEIRRKYDASFNYQFHDLRATFAMNMVDSMTPLMDRGEMTYTRVLDFIRTRMFHASPTTTERYLKYRENLQLKYAIQDGWETHLKGLMKSATGIAR